VAGTIAINSNGTSRESRFLLTDVQPLLEHKSLKSLTLVGAIAKANNYHPSLLEVGDLSASTPLQELTLLDCLISGQALHRVLEFPRALKTLSMRSSHDTSQLTRSRDYIVSAQEYIQAISDTTASQSLQNLRLDLTYMGWTVGPVSGMHKLLGLRHLEISPNHLLEFSSDDFGYPLRVDRNSSAVQLLPPNLEVLKVTPNATELNPLYLELIKQVGITPSLRKIILSSHYRDDEDLVTLMKHFQAVYEERGWDIKGCNLPLFLTKLTPRRPANSYLQRVCDESGVEYHTLYEDSYLLHLTGVPKPVWEDA
jgi:hypothetical protein